MTLPIDSNLLSVDNLKYHIFLKTIKIYLNFIDRAHKFISLLFPLPIIKCHFGTSVV